MLRFLFRQPLLSDWLTKLSRLRYNRGMNEWDKTTDKVLEALETNRATPVSGAALAKEAGVSRNAVWKAVNALVARGYPVTSSRKGYTLSCDSDVVSAQGIAKYLDKELSAVCNIDVRKTVSSTNTVAKELASAGAPEWTVAVATEQTGGRGRQGRRFYSGAGAGVYFTVVVRPRDERAGFLTVIAALAATRAIEKIYASSPAIKWVNDVYVAGRKCVGILTEAVTDLESRGIEFAVVGTGFNLREPDGGYPEEIRDIAGTVGAEASDGANRVVACMLNEYYALYTTFDKKAIAEEYRARSFLIGRKVMVVRSSGEREAVVTGIDDECRLEVDYGGERDVLDSGEVRLLLR